MDDVTEQTTATYGQPSTWINGFASVLLLVGTYVKERDNNRMKSGETGVVFWSKVYYLSMRDMGEAHILYINGR